MRPGNRGYLLTLGERMRGTICIDGEEKDVAEFVRRGGEGDGPGGFRATPISGKDWGVVDLDETGDYKLFFQFVPLEESPVFFTPPVIFAGLGGYLLVERGAVGRCGTCAAAATSTRRSSAAPASRRSRSIVGGLGVLDLQAGRRVAGLARVLGDAPRRAADHDVSSSTRATIRSCGRARAR